MPDILKTVGRYEILREVGRGGMAMVYLARQTDLDRFVALKELAAFHASDPAFAQRFLRESRVAGSLSHPNIVTVHDYFEHDGTPYIAMEYVERGSLRPYVGSLSLAQIGGVLEGVLAGLAQAEQHAIVHRDLKPENLMVTADGRVKIADFGIAKATNQLQTGAFLTATGTTVGTPTYMAPEQAMAQEIGPWTDLYSVGCMAFEMFTGRVPFHDSDAPMAILLRHVNEPIPPVKELDDSVDQGVSDWIERLLVKDPKARTQSANEAWDDLEEIIIGLLGPRWRRGARLTERAEQVDTPKPLTPAPFEGTTPGESAPPSDEFQSFGWGQPGPATPPPQDAPPGPLEPGPIDVPTGPPTPPPLEPVQESGFLTFGAPSQPAEEPVAREAPPGDAAAPPAAAPAGDAAAPPAGEAAAPPAPPPAAAPHDAGAATPATPPAAPPPSGAPDDAGAAPPAAPPSARPPEPDTVPPDDGVAHAPGFETYVAPEPLHPPVDEPAAAAPPPAAPPPEPPPVEAPPPAERSPVEEAPRAAAPPPPAPSPVEEPPADDLGATVMPERLKRAPAEPRERPSRAFPIALGAALLVAIVAGVLLGGGGSDDGGGGAGEQNTSTPVTSVDAGPVQLKVPRGYAALGSVPPIPGLGLGDGAAYAPGGRDGGRAVVFGATDVEDSSLMPPRFRGALGLEQGQLPDRTPVKLGPDELQAFRAEGLTPAGVERQVTVYTSPTSEGVATIACLAPDADAAAFRGECEAIANTLQLTSGTAFPIGPDKRFAKTISDTFRTLDDRVAKGRRAIDRDGAKFRAQGAAARDVQAAYAAAARQLRRAEVSPADAQIRSLLVGALDASAAAWKKAASAAVSKDKRGFARSQQAIERAQRKLDAAEAGLASIGYKVEQ